MAKSTTKTKTKNPKVRDIKPKKDAKGGGGPKPVTSPLGGTGGLGPPQITP